jgi:hypothetical protein
MKRTLVSACAGALPPRRGGRRTRPLTGLRILTISPRPPRERLIISAALRNRARLGRSSERTLPSHHPRRRLGVGLTAAAAGGGVPRHDAAMAGSSSSRARWLRLSSLLRCKLPGRPLPPGGRQPSSSLPRHQPARRVVQSGHAGHRHISELPCASGWTRSGGWCRRRIR